MAISLISPSSPFLFMFLSRQEPAYSDHLHYPKQICFEVLRFCKKKDPFIPHEKKCSKLINSLEQMYIIIGFASFFQTALQSRIGNRQARVPLILQRLASCLCRLEHPAAPACTSKRSAYLLETKRTGHFVAPSHCSICKSISQLFFSAVAKHRQGSFPYEKRL